MPKLKNNSLIVLLVVIILGALIVVGQQGDPMAKKDNPVTDRFENAIKAKEPKFKLESKHESKNQGQHSVLQGWKSDNDVVSATTYEFASAAEAEDLLKKTLNAPMSVPVHRISLTQLGDEAYLSPNDRRAKDGQTDLFFRKGRFAVIMSASNPGLAQRFARHIADEIN